MKIEYKSSVNTPAGFRGVYIVALADKISEKRCKVSEVLTIDDEAPDYGMSRTGANRQRYNGHYTADLEKGKTKNLSAVRIVK